MSQKEAFVDKPKTTRVSNPIAVSIHKIITILESIDPGDAVIVLATINRMYLKWGPDE